MIKNPEDNQSIKSYLCFNFLDALIDKGRIKPLMESDIYPIRDIDNVVNNVLGFQEYWSNEPNPSVIKYVLKDIGLPKLLLIAVCLGSYSFVAVIFPYILANMVKWIEDENRLLKDGLIYSFQLFVLSYLINIFFAHGSYLADRHEMRIKGYIANAIYRKSLRIRSINNEDKEENKDDDEEIKKKKKKYGNKRGKNKDDEYKSNTTTGQIVNLMSSDAQKIAIIPLSVANMLIVPSQVILIFVLLYQLVGVAIFAGLGVIVIVVPLILVFFLYVIKFEKGRAKTADKRLKITNEVLQGIRVVKFYGWTQKFINQINLLREEEIIWIKKILYQVQVLVLSLLFFL